ncbi:ANTAR domain-containing protein [Actinomycetospora termitidis]|uniref:ANTAR domain-containing protein n=1 Tax=Actinomycetospora termitidis TaxID=3053470 RepID=A0ABT7MGM9_9PSEU|nr:ANTAR domain-containing protein [Actinomycetospora sp. Odt1-22]MDL5159850.1 ANTAR domain-containing protein [Actinomycetospora sp. Odt1-22]
MEKGTPRALGEEPDALAAVLDLLDRIDPLLGELDPADDTLHASIASETTAMHRARARLSRDRARQMRERLESVRRRATELAESMRSLRAERAVETSGPWWDPLRTASAHLLGAHLEDRDDVHRHLLLAARSAVPTAAGVGLVWHDEDRLVVLHEDDPVLDALVARDRAVGTGPTHAALAGADVRVPDLPHDRQWPDLARDLAGLDVRSLLGIRLTGPGQDRNGDHTHVAAIWHAPGAHALDGAPPVVATLLAQQTALVVAGARRAADLNLALDTRDVIGQAKGILVARDRLSPEDAFDRLVEASQSSNVKLRDVAVWLVEETRRE